MPIYRCNQCGHVSESPTAGMQVPCARCAQPSNVYDTVFFVQKLLERYSAAHKEIKSLQAQIKADDETDGEVTGEAVGEKNGHTHVPAPTTATPSQAADMDVLNTSSLATAAQHAPIEQWLKSKQIEARFEHANVDTTGYFDDAARMLGERFDLFGELLDRVAYAYRKSHSGINLELGNLSQKDGQAVNTLCRQLYSHTFFSRYHYQKPEKVVRLSLQPAPKVRQFFEGGWLEWYALIELLQHLQSRQLGFSCARGVKVVFAKRRPARAGCGGTAPGTAADLHRVQERGIQARHRQIPAPAQTPGAGAQPLHHLRHRHHHRTGYRTDRHV